MSGSTVVTAGQFLKAEGAKSVHFMATHGLFADNGAKRINDSEIDSVVVTNSVDQPAASQKIKNYKLRIALLRGSFRLGVSLV